MSVRVFKDIEFDDWARRDGPTDRMLCEAADEIEMGLVDARLGGFLLKKRVAAPGRGKRGGYRTILVHRQGDRLGFLHRFPQNQKDNIPKKEKTALLKLGDQYMGYDDATMLELVKKQAIVEIRCHEQNSQQRP